jgi:hypothetical protein
VQQGSFDPQQILQAALDTGFVELPVRSDAAVRVAGLPPHHRDPFDRLLIAQAISEPVRLYTADPLLPPYSELVTLFDRFPLRRHKRGRLPVRWMKAVFRHLSP